MQALRNMFMLYERALSSMQSRSIHLALRLNGTIILVKQ